MGYVLRGVLEAYRFTRDPSLLASCRRTADALLSVIHPSGFLPGRLRRDWTPAASWACLTGTAQIATCWLMLYAETEQTTYRDVSARLANSYVRRTLKIEGRPMCAVE